MSVAPGLDIESQLNLKRDSEAVVDFVWGHCGAVCSDARNQGVFWLILRPRTQPNEVYIVRVAWLRYPHEAPSVKFADEIGGRLDVTSAWPVIPGYRPGNFDICQPFTREGFAVHPDWRQGPDRWKSTGNPFLWVSQTLQLDLDNRCVGRSG